MDTLRYITFGINSPSYPDFGGWRDVNFKYYEKQVGTCMFLELGQN